MEIILSRGEILKLASKLNSSKGKVVETMKYSITVDIQPDSDIFTKKCHTLEN